jgi:DNA polymerase
LKEYCDSKDIELPASLAMTNPVANAWFEEYKDDKAIGSIRNYRRMNKLRCVYDSVNNKLREDGSVATTLKYFGAHTGRWSGGEGNDKGEPSSLNWQNLPKKPLFDTDLRKCIMAPPGHVLGVVDLSQIEPRALAWVVDDQEFLDLVRQGISIYEAHARLTMNYVEDSPLNEFDPDWYSLAKARVLALGYGAGWKKFQAMAHSWGIEIDDETAKSTVRQFRQSNEKIMNFHEFLDTKLYNNIGGSFTMTLPTGRDMVYNNIRGTDVFKWGRVCTEIYCNRGFSKKNVLVYGGLLVENYVQALAREVFAKALLNLHAAGYDVRVHVHDEAVAVLPIRTAEQDLQAIIDIMSVTPDWLPGCPIACEGHITERYVKK